MNVIACPRCHKNLNVPDKKMGRWITCVACKMEFAAILDEPISEPISDYDEPSYYPVKTRKNWVLPAVIALTVTSICLVVLIAIRSSSKSSVTITVPLNSVGDDKTESELIAEIIGNRFWMARPTKQKLLEIVDLICSKPANTVIYVDDDLGTSFSSGLEAHFQREDPIMRPRTRHIMIDIDVFSKRPSRIDILRIMPKKLDRAEFEKPKQ